MADNNCWTLENSLKLLDSSITHQKDWDTISILYEGKTAAECEEWFTTLVEMGELVNSPLPEPQKKPHKKKFRRRAENIERKFPCTIPSCGRAYGTEGALKRHFQKKHKEVRYSRARQVSDDEEPAIELPQQPTPTPNLFQPNLANLLGYPPLGVPSHPLIPQMLNNTLLGAHVTQPMAPPSVENEMRSVLDPGGTVRLLQAELAFSNAVIQQQSLKIEYLLQTIKQNEAQHTIYQEKINQLEQSILTLNNLINRPN